MARLHYNHYNSRALFSCKIDRVSPVHVDIATDNTNMFIDKHYEQHATARLRTGYVLHRALVCPVAMPILYLSIQYSNRVRCVTG